MSQIIWQAVNNSQTLNLETEIHRIAELVTQIAHQMGTEGATQALTMATDGAPHAGDRVYKLAQHLISCTEQIQTEVDRFLTTNDQSS